MRLRKRKDTKETLKQLTNLVVLEPTSYRGTWREVFDNDHPIFVELGMGKGKFISEMSCLHPKVNFIGIDMYDELIRKASDKVFEIREETGQQQLGNLRLALFNIESIEKVFAPQEIERIFLNFSDPWPKKRHGFRRLTHPRFLQKYKSLLNLRGEIHFKTDSRHLFEFSLNAFADMDLTMRHISLDLHADGLREDLVVTEYERKFVEQGMPIYRCEVVMGNRSIVGVKSQHTSHSSRGRV